jgi:hypothetical protein
MNGLPSAYPQWAVNRSSLMELSATCTDFCKLELPRFS